jgi:putative DNA primase/helicase
MVDSVDLMNSQPPKVAPPIFDAIPNRLREMNNWVGWRYGWREDQDKPTKIPLNLNLGGKASSKSPATWASFELARQRYEQYGAANPNGLMAGVGFCLSDDLVGIDLDHCRDAETGVIEPWAVAIINAIDSYAEVSPSSTGIRIFALGRLPAGRKRTGKGHPHAIEMYDQTSPRYLTVTGRHLEGTPDEPQERTEELARLHAEIFPSDAQDADDPEQPQALITLDRPVTEELVQGILAVAFAASNGQKFRKLWERRWEDEYPSESDADLALASLLAFYVGPDIQKLDEVFRASPHYQNKDHSHQRKWEREDYRSGTLEKAVSGRCEFYKWKKSVELEVPEVMLDAWGVDEEQIEYALRQGPETEESVPPDPPAAVTAPPPHAEPKTAVEIPLPAARDMTDLGNALLFERLFGVDLRWVKQWRKWIRWTGHYWEPVEPEVIIAQYVHPMVRTTMIDLAKQIDDDDYRKKWLGWAISSNSAHRVKAMLEMAQARMMVKVEGLNSDPYLFATRNAIIDLRTCEPIPARREQWITILSPVEYNPEAACPIFQQFLAEVLVNEDDTPCPEMIEYLQRAFGFCLTPSVAEQVFFILWGVGQNGKSTLMDVICKVLGDYAIAGSESLYFEGRDRSNNEDEARLYGKRLCVTSETKQATHFSEPKIKRLTGGDRITASYKYQSQFEFSPTHKLFLCCNDKPKFNVDDPAIVRRIKLVPFYHVVPPEERDNHLPEKLQAELSGILNWMLAGLRQYNSGRNLQDQFTPEIMRLAKDGYLAECDRIGDFIDECTATDPTMLTPKDDIYQRYRTWAEDNGLRPYAKANLGPLLEKRGWQESRTKEGRYWVGHRLKAATP